MKTLYRAAGASVIGISHIENGIPCQDKIYSKIKSSVAAISLADGAGSCSKSEIGADVCTKYVVDFLCDNFDKTFLQNEEDIANLILSGVTNSLKKTVKEFELDIMDLSSTLLFVAVKKDKFIAGHIGDGLIGAFDGSGCHVLSSPDNGEFANETFFITEVNALEHFRIYKDKLKDTTGYILMSDGSYESLYDTQKGELAPANVSFFSWLVDYDNTKEEVEKGLEETLTNKFTKKTKDDCSINLLSTKHIEGYFDKVIKKIQQIKWWAALTKITTP